MRMQMGTGPRGGVGRRSVSALTLAAGLLFLPHTAEANPAILFVDGGSGGALVPRSTADVRIVSERLEFVERIEEGEPQDWNVWDLRLPWHVRAEYVLENLTARRIEADVGFPVAGDRGNWHYGDAEAPAGFGVGQGTRPFAASFHVRLDGADVPHRLVQNDCPAASAAGAAGAQGYCYANVFVFHLALEANAQVALTVEYDQVPALCCDDDGGHEFIYAWTDYILETGALWAGTIGRLDIVYHFAVPPPGGAMVYDKLVGPLLAGEGPWRRQTDEGAPQGWSRRAQRVAAPEGVLDLWNPSVRFHYAFACRDNRIVLRLKATDVEPRGNLSLGVQNIQSRLELAAGRQYYGEPDFEPCATFGEPEDPEAEWGCSFVHHTPFWNHGERDVSVREYRFDCCCASAAQAGGWNPNCDAEPRGKGCAAAASTGGSPPPAPLVQAVVAPDAGVPDADDGAEAGDAPAAVAEAGPDAEPKAGVPDDDDAAVVDATWSPAADGSGPEGGPLTATADATPPSAASPESVDASTAPSGQPTKKGCGCTVAGADDAVWSGLAALGVLLLARKRRRVSTQRSDHSKLRLASPEAPAGSSWGEGIQARSATAVHR